EVNMEVRATKLAVRNALETHVFLKLHDLRNCTIFYFTQLLGRNLALGLLFTRVQQIFRAQKTAHMICTKRRIERNSHNESFRYRVVQQRQSATQKRQKSVFEEPRIL